jgi:hypothetical protein
LGNWHEHPLRDQRHKPYVEVSGTVSSNLLSLVLALFTTGLLVGQADCFAHGARFL